MLGRNELCQCGSGKKYKKCCLNKDVLLERAGRKIVLSQTQYSQLYSKIYNYSKQEKFNIEREKAKEMFYILENEQTKEKFDRFFNTYFIQDHIMENKKVMTVEFFEENRDSLNHLEIEVLKSLFESYVSIYEVKEMLDGKVILTDCLTKTEACTDDINLLKDFNIGDCMIGRMITVGDTSILIDITISISEAVKDVIVNDMLNLFAQYEDIYKDIKTFLVHHTHILYKYIQQLLDTDVADHLKAQRDKKSNTNKTALDGECNVCNMLRNSADEESVEACIEFWNKFKESQDEIKGSENGWAAAVEYHIKKDSGKNVTQAQISKKYDISPSTLGKRYKDLKI